MLNGVWLHIFTQAEEWCQSLSPKISKYSARNSYSEDKKAHNIKLRYLYHLISGGVIVKDDEIKKTVATVLLLCRQIYEF